MEAEKEKLRKEIEAEIETKYSKHREAIETLGGDPDKVINLANENKRIADANRLAEQNGWNEDQTTWYLENQKKDQRLKELEVKVEINSLKDKTDYAGIGSMEKEILAKIEQSKGALSVEEAYWALGGSKKAAQIKLEAQMREAENRKKQPRTVLTDSQTANSTEKPLPPDVLRDAERMGISVAEAHKLMKSEAPKNIDDYRKSKAK